MLCRTSCSPRPGRDAQACSTLRRPAMVRCLGRFRSTRSREPRSAWQAPRRSLGVEPRDRRTSSGLQWTRHRVPAERGSPLGELYGGPCGRTSERVIGRPAVRGRRAATHRSSSELGSSAALAREARGRGSRSSSCLACARQVRSRQENQAGLWGSRPPGGVVVPAGRSGPRRSGLRGSTLHLSFEREVYAGRHSWRLPDGVWQGALVPVDSTHTGVTFRPGLRGRPLDKQWKYESTVTPTPSDGRRPTRACRSRSTSKRSGRDARDRHRRRRAAGQAASGK